MLGLSLAVGIVAGLGAVVFRHLVALIHNLFFFGRLSADYDATAFTAPSSWGPFILLVPALGGLINIWTKRVLAGQGGGHGVPDVIVALHLEQGRIPVVSALWRALASAFSAGSGASVGREGPTVMLAASGATIVSNLMGVGLRDRLILLAAGAGAGLGAAFNAPVAGALFALEVLLPEMSARSLPPLLIASLSAGLVTRVLIGADPEFAVIVLAGPRGAGIDLVLTFGVLVLLGVLLGAAGWGFIRALDRGEALLLRWLPNPYWRHGVAMTAVGVMIALMFATYGHYYLFGAGYAAIYDLSHGDHHGTGFLALLLAAKLLATVLSLGSGASGGVFSATLYLGAALGGIVGQTAMALWPGLDLHVGTAAILGMAGLLAATTGAPFFSIVLILEVTGDSPHLLAIGVVAVIALGTRRMFGRASIYTSRLIDRGLPIPEGLAPTLVAHQRAGDAATVPVSETAETGPAAALIVRRVDGRIVGYRRPGGDEDRVDFVVVAADASVRLALARMAEAAASTAFAITATGAVTGAITLETLGQGVRDSAA